MLSRNCHVKLSALIAGVIVVMADWKNSASRSLRKINCTLQNALVEKAAWCVAMREVGYSTHSNSAVSLPLHASNSAFRSSAKSSKLQRPKICMVGCDVLCGVCYAFQLRCFAIAPPLHKKTPTVKKSYQETPFKKWFLMDFRKLFRIRIRCV